MTTTVKLPPELEHQLRQRSTQEGRSISELMRDALSAYLQNVPPPKASAFSLGADLFGRHASFARSEERIRAIFPQVLLLDPQDEGNLVLLALKGPSLPVSSPSTAANCPVREMHRLTAAGSATTSVPHTEISPEVGSMSVETMLTSVVLPAPLAPSRDTTCPCGTSNVSPLSTSVALLPRPNVLHRSHTRSAA